MPLFQFKCVHAVMADTSEIPALAIKMRGLTNRAGDKCNPLRIQRAAAPDYQGYV